MNHAIKYEVESIGKLSGRNNYHCQIIFYHGTNWDNLTCEKEWLVQRFKSIDLDIVLNEPTDPYERSEILCDEKIIGNVECDLLLESVYFYFIDCDDAKKFHTLFENSEQVG